MNQSNPEFNFDNPKDLNNLNNKRLIPYRSYLYKTFNVFVVLLLIFSSYGCPSFKDVLNTISNVKSLQYKLDRVDNFTLSGVRLNNKSGIKDFTIQEGLMLTQAFATKSFPTTFDLVVTVKNPNSGVKENIGTPITMSKLAWNLFIDNQPTISGVVNKEIVIPPSNSTVELPITISLDMLKFFGDKGYDNLLNLALNLGGAGSKPSKLMLEVTPELKTKYGVLPIKNSIQVINTEFR